MVWMAIGQLAWIAGANAADPPMPGPLDRPIVDLALLHQGRGPEMPPLLLTLETVDLPRGTVRVTILDRAGGWHPVGSATISLFEPAVVAEAPWLIQIEPDRFVILATSREQGRTVIVPMRVSPGGTVPLEVGPAATLALVVDNAGAIDVDADGSTELVVSARDTSLGREVCQGSVIRVLDGSTLAQRSEWAVANTRLAGGVLGEWDGRPGGDLLAYVHSRCPPGTETAERQGLIALRLADGTPIATVVPQDRSGSTASPGVPLVADFDGDGRDEVVIRDGEVLTILDPAHGWARTDVARDDVTPLSAAGPDAAGRFGTLVWLEHEEIDDGLVMSVGKVVRSPVGSLEVGSERLELSTVPRPRRAQVFGAMRDVAIAQAGPQAWRGDIDGDGCTDLLVPLLTAQCTGGVDPSLKVGATWFATRPVVAFDAGGYGSRELLIAATMEWHPSGGGPLPATPIAVALQGAWRHGPSAQFALSEVRAADAAYFNVFPVPRPTIERAPVRSQATDFPGFTGARVFLRVTAARSDDPPPAETPTLAAFLADPPSREELISVGRVPVPTGAESGRDGSFVRVSLADVIAPDGGPGRRWTVTIVQVNDWGEVAGPVRGTIIRDSTGPSLTVDAPFLSAPWPLDATIHGRSEPGIEVRGGSGGPVVADRRGRFELRTQLAPWPQTVELTAIDQSGNTTTSQFSLVGGVDYRDFPWAAIVAVALLLGAVLSAGRGTHAVRDPESIGDSDPRPEIEELPAGEWPRA